VRQERVTSNTTNEGEEGEWTGGEQAQFACSDSRQASSFVAPACSGDVACATERSTCVPNEGQSCSSSLYACSLLASSSSHPSRNPLAAPDASVIFLRQGDATRRTASASENSPGNRRPLGLLGSPIHRGHPRSLVNPHAEPPMSGCSPVLSPTLNCARVDRASHALGHDTAGASP
jgi:hypothetical protein